MNIKNNRKIFKIGNHIKEITNFATEVNYIEQEEETVVANTGFVALELESSNIYKLYTAKIIKEDANDETKKLSDVEYEITIKNDSVEKKVTKTTNAWGEINIAVSTKQNTTITIIETKAKKGYILDRSAKTVSLGVSPSGDFILNNTSGSISASLDTENQLIEIKDTNLKKTDSNIQKANISFYFTKRNQDGNLLGNVSLKVTELKTGEIFNVTTDNLGKATIPSFAVNDVGKYTFEIEEVSTVPGFLLLDSKITLEVTYQIIDETMESVTQFIRTGEKYITNKEYNQYETDTTYQMDVHLDIVNDSDPLVSPVLIDIKNIAQSNGIEILGGSYDVIINYDDGSSIYYNNVSVTSGIEISKLYVKDITTIELIEKDSPLGYEKETTSKIIKVGLDNNLVPYVNQKSSDINARIYQRVNNDFSVDDILEIEITKEKQNQKFSIKIIKGLDDIQGYTIPGVTFDMSISGDINQTQTTDNNGQIVWSGLKQTGNIEIILKETAVPYGYKMKNDADKITLNRDSDTLEMVFIEAESTITSQDISIDYINQEVTIFLKNDIDFTVNIEKVDEFNPTNKLEGAKFEVVSNSTVQADQIVTTDKNGKTSAIFDTAVANTTVIYTIKETEAPEGFRKADEFKLQVEFNNAGKIKNYQILDNGNKKVDWAEIYLPNQYVLNTTTGVYEIRDVYKDNTQITLRVFDSDRYNFIINKVDTRNQTTGGSAEPITGAEFDITVSYNGKSEFYHKATLNGIIELNDLEGNGEIVVNYQETQPAYGYTNSNLEKGTIVFNKDAQTNQLTLDNTKTTVDLSRVSVNNATGDIEVEVHNESNFEMGIKTIDAISGLTLDGARWQVNVTDSNGNTLDSDTKDTTNGGEAIFDLGTVYKSQTIRYTITEVVAPSGYTQVYDLIDDVIVDLHFDQYGSATYSIIEGSDRIKNIEIPNGASYISNNFKNNQLNLEITNGEQDEYTIRLVKENENNPSIKVKGAEFQIVGIDPDTSEQFNIASAKTNTNGTYEIKHVDIQDGFKLTVQELQTVDGYVLDNTLRTIDFSATLSTTGAKIIDYTTTDTKITVSVDNVHNVIQINIPNEPKDVGIAIKKVDENDSTVLLAGARFVITDTDSGNSYNVITGDNGIGYVNIPIKPDGTYTYRMIETQSPLGYNKAIDMSLELQFEDNKLKSATEGIGSNIFDIDAQQDKYLEMTVRNKEDDGILDEYTVEILRVNENNLSEGIPNAKTKIEISNNYIATINKEDYTNSNGSIYLNNGIKGPGKTAITVTETANVEGYLWNATPRIVYLDRNSETEKITLASTSGISSSRVSIDHNNKIVKIILGSPKQGVYVSTGTNVKDPFQVQIVSVAKGTNTGVYGYYTTVISPDPINPGSGWPVSSYNFVNKRTEKQTIYLYRNPWDSWKGAFVDDRPETGNVWMTNLYGTGDIHINVTQTGLAPYYIPMSGSEEIIVNRDPVTGQFTLVQDGVEAKVSFDQTRNLIIIKIEPTPTFTINLEKRDSADIAEKLQGVEFEVTSNIGQTATIVTDATGTGVTLVGESKPNTTVEYVIKETKKIDGYKQLEDIKLTVIDDEQAKCDNYFEIIVNRNFLYTIFLFLLMYKNSLPSINAKLTPREIETLQHMEEGECNDKIAKGMNVSVHTIKINVRSIFQKLSVKDRTAAVIKAIRHGLIDIFPDDK